MSKPFKFKPNKRSITDGAPRQRSNGDNAADADEMLSLVRDADSLAQDEVLRDALTNILHWCDREGVDFEKALRMAKGHHEAEK